jgi:hypothetical protein
LLLCLIGLPILFVDQVKAVFAGEEVHVLS